MLSLLGGEYDTTPPFDVRLEPAEPILRLLVTLDIESFQVEASFFRKPRLGTYPGATCVCPRCDGSNSRACRRSPEA
jgi:hypothetical protein